MRDPLKPLIAIIGLGGIGKTALAEEAVRTLKQEEFFTRVVWISTQAEKFTGEKVEQVEIADYTFGALLSDILSQSDMASSARSAVLKPKLQAVEAVAIERNASLIVLDNLETVVDRDALVGQVFEILGKGEDPCDE